MRYLIACGIMPPELGGPASVIRKLAVDLLDAGHAVSIMTYTPNPTRIDGVQMIPIPRGASALGRYTRFFFAVRRALRTADALIATDVFSVGLPCRCALVGLRKTFVLRLGGEWRWEQAVTSGRSHETLRSFWGRRPTVRDLVDRVRYHWILKRASRIITTSEWFSEFLAGVFPDLRASFISVPNVSTIRCSAESKSRPHQPLRLLYIGRFAPVKNVLFFAKALRELARRGVNIACTFVGDGETKAECEDVLREVPNVTFTGSVQHADLRTYLDESDVFILPSLTDICPNAVVEALSCGLPCLVTKEHGLPGPLSGAIELDPQDMDAWILAMTALTRTDSYEDLLRAVKPVDTSRFPTLLEAVQRV